MQIALISPYHGGSHRAWAEGFQRHSRHEVRLLALPARFWKWRMHGGAVTLARLFKEQDWRPDVLLATDMLDLTTFLALARPRTPTILYMHENQLTYPLPPAGSGGPMRRQRGERDLHYAFINYASMLAADAIWFNSAYHRRTLLDALPNLLKHFPEYNELETLPLLARKSRVLPVGIDVARLDAHRPEPQTSPAPPLILWNQRWEYDKNPAAFFRALYRLADEGLAFRLALCGENFRRRPLEFDEALERLAERIIHAGYARPERYHQLLWQADVTVSTTHHEFFGISILEAIAAHTFPVLPGRLSYPELIPESFHSRCLYEDEAALLQRLRWALRRPQEAAEVAAQLATFARGFAWPAVAPRYDEALEAMIR